MGSSLRLPRCSLLAVLFLVSAAALPLLSESKVEIQQWRSEERMGYPSDCSSFRASAQRDRNFLFPLRFFLLAYRMALYLWLMAGWLFFAAVRPGGSTSGGSPSSPGTPGRSSPLIPPAMMLLASLIRSLRDPLHRPDVGRVLLVVSAARSCTGDFSLLPNATTSSSW